MQRHSVTSLETASPLTNDPSWGGGAEGEVEKFLFCVPQELQCLLSLFCLVTGKFGTSKFGPSEFGPGEFGPGEFGPKYKC